MTNLNKGYHVRVECDNLLRLYVVGDVTFIVYSAAPVARAGAVATAAGHQAQAVEVAGLKEKTLGNAEEPSEYIGISTHYASLPQMKRDITKNWRKHWHLLILLRPNILQERDLKLISYCKIL